MDQLPIPSNMEGDRRGSPYGWYRTAFNPRLVASEAMMAALPGPAGIVDSFTGNRIQGFTDRLAGASMARSNQETNAYMRDLMRSDPGYQQYSLSNRIRNLFGRGNQQQSQPGGGQPTSRGEPSSSYSPAPMPYSAPQALASSPQWGTGGQAPRLQFQNYLPTPIGQGRTDLYGSGQGMMRGPEQAPAPRGAPMLPSANNGSLGNRAMMGVISGQSGIYNFMDSQARAGIIWPEYVE